MNSFNILIIKFRQHCRQTVFGPKAKRPYTRIGNAQKMGQLFISIAFNLVEVEHQTIIVGQTSNGIHNTLNIISIVVAYR